MVWVHPPPLDSEMGWTRELWWNTNLLKQQIPDIGHMPNVEAVAGGNRR